MAEMSLISRAKSGLACFGLCSNRALYREEEQNTMKSRIKNAKIKAAPRSGRPITDPTLEGKDESKVGRIQEKISPVNWEAFLANIYYEKTVTEYRIGRTIFRQGRPADSLFYLRRGRVKFTTVSPQGKETIVAVLSAGEFFGEGCLAGQRSRVATAVAMTDCTVEKIGKSVMVRLLHDQHKLYEMFVKHLLSRNLQYEADLGNQRFNSSERRLAQILLLLAHFGKESRADSVVPSVSQKTLAHIVGTTQPKISRFMIKFKKLGFINYNGHGLTVNSRLLNVVLRD
jgi:CRP/FNR family transcriptional regulator, cyclic AMP receptor protein